MFIWSLCFLFAGGSVFAQSSQAAPAAVSPSALEIETDIHGEYLVGEPMLVRFTVQNTGEKTLGFSDLSARPWLVRFKISGENTATQTRYNLPPKVDEGRQWEVAPRGRREVLLEIPSSSTFKVGDYNLEIRILEDAGERVIPSQSFRIRSAVPAGGQVNTDTLSTARGGHQVLWVHQGEEGVDLYLHHSEAQNPERTVGNYHLLHLEKAVEPVLAQSAPQQVWDRHVYWMQSKNSLRYARIRGHAFRGPPASLNFPYPEVQLLGRGATDSDGTLHVPVWIPGPRGNGGELRVASVDTRGTPRFRLVFRAAAVPELLVSGVDSTGGLRVLVGDSGSLDFYTLTTDLSLPAFGKRVFPKEAGIIAAQFGFLPEAEGVAGGMSIAVVYGESTPEGTVLRLAWLGMNGLERKSWPSLSIAPGVEFKGFFAQADGFGVVVQDAGGGHRLLGPNGTAQAIPAAQLGTLIPILNGGLAMRRLVNGGPIKTTLLK
jgi:hypothetical protein